MVGRKSEIENAVKTSRLNSRFRETRTGLVVRYPYAQLALWVGLGPALVGLVATGSYAVNKRRSQLQAERALAQEFEDELQTAREMQMRLMPTESPQLLVSTSRSISGRLLEI